MIRCRPFARRISALAVAVTLSLVASAAAAVPIELSVTSQHLDLAPPVILPTDQDFLMRTGSFTPAPSGDVATLSGMVTGFSALNDGITDRHTLAGVQGQGIYDFSVHAPGAKALEFTLATSADGYLYSSAGGTAAHLMDVLVFNATTNEDATTNSLASRGEAFLNSESLTRRFIVPGSEFTGRLIVDISITSQAFPNPAPDSTTFALFKPLDFNNPVDAAFVRNFVPLTVLQNFDSTDFGLRWSLGVRALPEPPAVLATLALIMLLCLLQGRTGGRPG